MVVAFQGEGDSGGLVGVGRKALLAYKSEITATVVLFLGRNALANYTFECI